MRTYALLTFLYGLLILCGGMIGFAQAHSIASLIMGTLFGALLLVSAWGMIKNYTIGFFSALVLAGLLTLFFSYRFYLTQKFMPAGLIATLSLVIMMVGIAWKPNQKIPKKAKIKS